MQLLSVEATIFFKKNRLFFCSAKHEKVPIKVAHNRPPFFFSIAYRPKSLLHKKFSLRDFYIMTLFAMNEESLSLGRYLIR